MVVYFRNRQTFSHDFETVTLAYFNRYPNPYAKHVKSIDTIDRHIDSDGRLHQTKIICKAGSLPQWVKPFLGRINTSWIVEKTIVDPKEKTMTTYNCNLDHTKLLRVEECTKYHYDREKNTTEFDSTVRFSSGFRKFGNLNVKDRIEDWSKAKFAEHSKSSRMGLKLVMESVRQKMAESIQSQRLKQKL
ncbi:DEKNAAC104925 [Brettanomyces naardenensis]|uniref:DEKNAAC104925 n=1 Tax=Brettanomyces naardenensis TaxID=13370 RepID=A0A448YRX8_BRENA|nr:DEKNAAC104925 [Brettanomyces naardenensis]